MPPGRPIALTTDHGLDSSTRACLSIGLAGLDRDARASDIARRFDDVRNIEAIIRAASAPSSTSNTTALTRVAVALLDALIPVSAGADLIARGIQLSFDGAATISVPAIAIPIAKFIGEGRPIPVVTAATSAGVSLSPHKVAAICLLTGEVMRSSNAEQLVRAVLLEAVGPALDLAMFSDVVADEDRPAGLLNGISALLPAGAGAKETAMADDLTKLGAPLLRAVGGPLVYIAAPEQAIAMVLRASRDIPSAVMLSSAALAPGTVIAIAANAIVSAVDGVPRIELSRFAEVHRETVPAEIAAAGSPAVVASPVISIYQSDEVALKLRWSLTWALRSPAAIAWMQNVNW